MPVKTLYAPSFPQMENDGVINLAELATSGVLINIAEYENAAPGDFLELWFESVAIDSIGLGEGPMGQYFPWPSAINPQAALLLPDGVYKVQYNLVDAAQNSFWSNIGKVIIDRTSTGTLPPPLFPEAGADNSLDYDDAMSGGGTPVTIPNYPGIAVDDNVTLFWVGTRDGKVIQESITSVSHTVQESELGGFNVTISTAFIIPENMDSARAWYVVTHTDIRNERSENGFVNINTSSGNTLPPPVFIEGDDEWIDADEAASDNGTPVQIPAYPAISVGDTVTTHWQGYSQNGDPVAGTDWQFITLVKETDLSGGFVVNIPTAEILPIGIGYGICYYNVLFASSEQGSSLAAEIGVDVTHSLELPAPTVPEALDDGVITETDAMSNGGTPVDVSYPSMAEGDSVSLFWSCYTGTDITPVPGTVYSATRSVTADEARLQTMTFTVPSKYITPTGKGYAVVNYTVNFHSGGIGYSDDSVANIDTEGDVITGSSYLGGSTGYAPWNNTVIQGCFVKYLAMDNGVPLRNVAVEFSLFGNNYFTNNKLKTITINTDFQGYAQTNISGSDTLNNTITAQIIGSSIPASTVGFETERTNDITVPLLTSEPYIPGTGNREFTLSVSEEAGNFTLSTNNNADIYIDGVNKGGLVTDLNVNVSSPVIFSITANNLNNTAITVSRVNPSDGSYCTYYF